MKQLILTLLAFGMLLFTQCKDDGQKNNRCNLEPDPGPCKALIVRYYYDKTEKKCKAFNWGGCDGIAPFETLEECESGCNDNSEV